MYFSLMAFMGLMLMTMILAGGGTLQAANFTLPLKFQFGPGHHVPGYIQVLPNMAYTPARGYGFDLGFKVKGVHRSNSRGVKGQFVTSNKPFFFSVKLPSGNYNVTVTLGDLTGPSVTTVKAEQRRLMFKKVVTAPGKFVTRTFTVNTRTPEISTGGKVRLKPREIGSLEWDNKLTIEFSNRRPCLCAMTITKAHPVTIFIAGDSTDTDQRFEPWCSWGQMFTRFFVPRRVVVANYAEDGESANSFIWENRLKKVMSVIRPGDYLFIEFGHNDQHERGKNAGPKNEYRKSLLTMIAQARAHHAIPVLVTPMARRLYRHGRIYNSLVGFPIEMRIIARQQHVALIDLNAMSTIFFNKLGPDESKVAFVDRTHNDDYGAYEIAKCMIRGIEKDHLPLEKFIRPGLKPFNPAHPDPVSSFHIPRDPQYSIQKPSGW
jgi:lysophospholipase L1-like esterase